MLYIKSGFVNILLATFSVTLSVSMVLVLLKSVLQVALVSLHLIHLVSQLTQLLRDQSLKWKIKVKLII
jgi:hypothetical protein